jgi:hypothetical protein
MGMDEQFASVLGRAVITCWGQLPQDVQHTLFERAVAASGDQGLREQLAVFLHDKHPRTAE